MSAKPKAADIKAGIARRHGCNGGSGAWVCINEALSGFACPGGGIDTLALAVHQRVAIGGCPGAGRKIPNPVVAYEVKVSRADMRRELNGYTPGPTAKWPTRHVPAWPGKAHHALLRSNYFLFATPPGLLKPEEIQRRERPEDGGLWLPAETVLTNLDQPGTRVIVPAPARDCQPLTVHETAELIRHAVDPAKLRALRGELVGRVVPWDARLAILDEMRELGYSETSAEQVSLAVLRRLQRGTEEVAA